MSSLSLFIWVFFFLLSVFRLPVEFDSLLSCLYFMRMDDLRDFVFGLFVGVVFLYGLVAVICDLQLWVEGW